MDYIKELIATRGVQLMARYAANGLMLLAGKYAFAASQDDVNATAHLAATAVAALACWAISSRTVAASALPSRIRAVMVNPAVLEKPHTIPSRGGTEKNL